MSVVFLFFFSLTASLHAMITEWFRFNLFVKISFWCCPSFDSLILLTFQTQSSKIKGQCSNYIFIAHRCNHDFFTSFSFVRKNFCGNKRRKLMENHCAAEMVNAIKSWVHEESCMQFACHPKMLSISHKFAGPHSLFSSLRFYFTRLFWRQV